MLWNVDGANISGGFWLELLKGGCEYSNMLLFHAAEIHGWFKISSNLILSFGSIFKQQQIKSLHIVESGIPGNEIGSSEQICSSVSNGMSPKTISYRRIPKLHTVALGPS